jgi:hypothetical protein
MGDIDLYFVSCAFNSNGGTPNTSGSFAVAVGFTGLPG